MPRTRAGSDGRLVGLVLVLACLACDAGGAARASVSEEVSLLAAGGRRSFASFGHTCAAAAAGVQCWGAGGSGELGDGRLASRRPLPVAVRGLPGPATALAAGGSHSCALVDASAWCWGDNTRGQVTPGPPLLRTLPVRLDLLPEPVTAIAAGDEHSCAIAQGHVWCWGRNEAGESGRPPAADCRRGHRVKPCSTAPVQVQGLPAPVTALALGGRHSCAIAAGDVHCWGANQRGQLGAPDSGSARDWRPRRVTGLDGPPSGLAAGRRHSCAGTGGGVTCWGWGRAPARVVLEGPVVRLAAGGDRSCASGSAGVWCWEASKPASPVLRLRAPDEVTALAVGADHVCAASRGEVRCVGDNDFGQLGGGDGPADRDGAVVVRPWDTGRVRDRDADGRIAIVCLGDSNTQSVEGAPESWCDALAGDLDDPRVVVVNRALGGATAVATASLQPGSAQLRYALEHDAPDVVLLAWGTNDVVAGVAVEEIAAAVAAHALRALEAGAEPFVALVPPVLPAGREANDRVRELNASLRSSWPSDRVLDFHSGFEAGHYEDALHLSAEGQRLRTRRASAVLRSVLPEPPP